MQDLTPRQQRERELHDAWARELDAGELLVERSFDAPTAVENRFILDYFGPLEGRRVLDLGAGAGEGALFFASRGARVTALDLSPAQLEVLSAAAASRGLPVETCAAPAERLPWADGTFDLVYGNGVLHHVDIGAAIPEVLRVTRPGGRLAFVEPLAYNPAIWAYRLMARAVRTPDERPLRARDVRWIAAQLEGGAHREFWISALALFAWFWLGEGVSPSQDRYWKKVIRDGERYRRLVRPLFAADRWLARLPGVRMLAWNTVIHGRKPAP